MPDEERAEDGSPLDEVEVSERIRKLKQLRGTAKSGFTRKENLFKNRLSVGDPVEALRLIYNDLDDKFKKLESVCDELINFCTLHDESQMQEANKYLEDCENIKCEIYAQLLRREASTARISSSHRALGTIRPKVEPIKLPKFKGECRNFPDFKDDIENIVVPNYGENASVLIQCLEDKALITVQSCEKDYDLMMQELEKEYGDSRKIVGEVIGDLKKLELIADDDDNAFIQMVHKVQKCYSDLKRVNLEDEMRAVNIVSMIECVLPRDKKSLWAKKSKSIKGKEQYFEKLFEFLVEEKWAINYCNADVREPSNPININISKSSENEQNEIMRTMKKMQENQAKMEKILNDLSMNPNHRREVNDKGGKYCYVHEVNGHYTSACVKFRSHSVNDRLDIANQRSICFNCLSSNTHTADDCPTGRKCVIRIKGNMCSQNHHPLLHDALVKNINIASLQKRGKINLEVSMIYCKNTPMKVVWDSGAEHSLITHRKARELGLSGKPVSGPMTGVGNKVHWVTSKEYRVTITDLNGENHDIYCIGMDEIAGKIAEVDLGQISKLFPEYDLTDLRRPSGFMDMLIGGDHYDLHPRIVASVGKLQLLKSIFGYSIRGKIPGEVSKRDSSLPIISMNMQSNISELREDVLKTSLDQFFEIEHSGISCEKQCTRCLCRGCPTSGDQTLKDERDYAEIEKGLKYNEDLKVWVASYPWIQDPYSLPNNFNAVMGRLVSTEKKLLTDEKYAESYQNEIDSMLMRGVARKLSERELTQYTGPVHYIAHFGVEKPDSPTTPLRIVFDSSTVFKGYRLNDFWAKGPNVINNIFAVLLRFRMDNVGIMGDISKMYHAVHLEELEMHVHRFLWRNMDQTKKPDHYILTRVTFGDRPSGAVATVALHKTAEMSIDTHPHVYEVIVSNTYVDDILPNASDRKEATKLTADIDEVIDKGGFKTKGWIMTGDVNQHVDMQMNMTKNDENKLKVLGMKWETEGDFFRFDVILNFQKRDKNKNQTKCNSRESCELDFPCNLTRRMVLSLLASIYDPLGLILPYILKGKILMRNLIKQKTKLNGGLDWDECLNVEMQGAWKQFFLGLFDAREIKFRRSVKPLNTIGNPTLIIFSDASQDSFGACAFIRWQVSEEEYEARLIAAKSRMAPNRAITIPCLEMCGAVLAVRLRETIINEMNFAFTEIIHIVDSSIVLSQIRKDSHKFKIFIANRVAEIQRKSKVDEWNWINSNENIADYVTKPRDMDDLKTESSWQKGPPFLTRKRQEWPICQEVNEELSRLTGELLINICSDDSLDQFPIDISRYSSVRKLIRVTARVLKVFKCKSLVKGMLEIPDTDILNKAEEMWIKRAQAGLSNWQVSYKSLGPFLQNGIIKVGGRLQAWLKETWNKDAYVLLPTNHEFTELVITDSHYQGHDGVETTLAKLLSSYWIPKVRKQIKRIKDDCKYCKRMEKKVVGQSMGGLTIERMKPSPPFYNSATDLFGPFAIRDNVKRRVKGKCFGVVFTCLSSRAVHIELAENYSTAAFLGALRRFSAIRGYPATLHSDNGTQMIAANKELLQINNELEQKKICEMASINGIQWSYNRSADSPWLNGACEALIKSIKVSLQKCIGDSILTFAELQTVCYEVADLVNSRPIGAKPGCDILLGSYLSPNDLLLGRSNRRPPVYSVDVDASPKRRMMFMQSIVNNFWRRWHRDYFPSLIMQKKWHTSKRNLQIGDVVLVQDSNAIRGVWRMAEVAAVEVGRDGKVRDVTVRYKTCTDDACYKGSKDKTMKRSAHKIVLIIPMEERV